MVVDAWVDLVRFACVRCSHVWSMRYDLLQSRGPAGVEQEYFSMDGIGLPSPYTPGGAVGCPRCAWPSIGRLLSRRSLEGCAGSGSVDGVDDVDEGSTGAGL